MSTTAPVDLAAPYAARCILVPPLQAAVRQHHLCASLARSMTAQRQRCQAHFHGTQIHHEFHREMCSVQTHTPSSHQVCEPWGGERSPDCEATSREQNQNFHLPSWRRFLLLRNPLQGSTAGVPRRPMSLRFCSATQAGSLAVSKRGRL